MFEKEAPWEHGYVRVEEIQAKNSQGGPVADVSLVFTEEVVVLRRRPQPKSEIGMEILGSYDVLRFDGTCAILAEDEFDFRRPYRTKLAPLAWRQLDPDIREALERAEPIVVAQKMQEADCHGLYIGGGDSQCRRATEKLTAAIMKELNRGLPLPTPKKVPTW